MPLWKIIIEGQSELDVQGVNLRETVERIAIGMGIKGYVKNNKRTKQVETICKCDDENIAKLFIASIEKNLYKNRLIEHKNIKMIGPGEYKDIAINEADIDGFEIRREDELTEMVWALQNAGKVFMKQPSLKEEQQFNALNAEIDAFFEVLKKIREGNNQYKEQLPAIAIESFLREPPLRSDNKLISLLHKLYRYAKTINNMIERGREKEDMPLDEIQQTLNDIEEILRSI